MKRLMSVCLIMAVVVTSVFANFGLSIGAHADYEHAFRIEKDKKVDAEYINKEIRRNNTLGFNVFFDAHYVRLLTGLTFPITEESIKKNGKLFSGTDKNVPPFVDLNVALLLKFPFEFEKISFYPLFGVQMSIKLPYDSEKIDFEKYKQDVNNADLRRYYLVGGIGADFFIGKNFFITSSTVFGGNVKKSTDYEELKKQVENYKDNDYIYNLQLGFGYKF